MRIELPSLVPRRSRTKVNPNADHPINRLSRRSFVAASTALATTVGALSA